MKLAAEGRPIIEPQIVLDIFSCIRELLELHNTFLQRLEARMENLPAYRSHTVADIFLLHVHRSIDSSKAPVWSSKLIRLSLLADKVPLAVSTLCEQFRPGCSLTEEAEGQQS